ncbi:MAG: peptidoglycan DD-metalloendopeptidase family protein [Bacillota bacterium]
MKKIKKWLSVMLTFVIISTMANTNQLQANTLSDLQDKRDLLAKETDEAKAKIEELEGKQATVLQEIEAMDQLMNALQKELQAAETEMYSIENYLANTEAELAAAIVEKEDQTVLLGTRLRFVQHKGTIGYLEILLDSKSFSDLFLRVQYINDIMQFDREILTKLEEIEENIEIKRQEVEQSLELQVEVVAYEAEKVKEMNAMLSEKNALMRSYEADEAKYDEIVRVNEAADKEVLALIAKESAGVGGTVYYTGSGNLGWPVPSKAASSSSLSSGYVNRTNPITGKYESHSGYDIPASYGSAIVAAETGKVIYSGWMNGYGNTIVIDHGGGLSTLYAHNSSLTVSKGSTVNRGQTVALCGSTGMSTGNHLHFSVLVNGSYVNPESYLGVGNVSY